MSRAKAKEPIARVPRTKKSGRRKRTIKRTVRRMKKRQRGRGLRQERGEKQISKPLLMVRKIREKKRMEKKPRSKKRAMEARLPQETGRRGLDDPRALRKERRRCRRNRRGRLQSV